MLRSVKMEIFEYSKSGFQPPALHPMKKILLFLVLVAPMSLRAQMFEGTIRWSMNLEITDPKTRAQMAEAEKKMADPETQKQIKEMQDKMNDPEMKKMMDQNPQMKAAMEQAMKSFGGGGMNSMMPKGMMMKVKSGSTVTIMEGGMMDGMEILHVSGKPPVRINRADKTYSNMPEGGPAGQPAPQVTVTKTSETATILGYTCTKYDMQMVQRGQNITQHVWATSDIKDMDMKMFASQRDSQGQPLFSDKIEGVPLKVESTMPQGNMVMEVKEIKKEKLSDADFTIPAGFKEVKSPY